VRFRVVEHRSYQRILCRWGFKNDKLKSVWLDVTDKKESIMEFYSFKEPPFCGRCKDEKTESICEVCVEDDIS